VEYANMRAFIASLVIAFVVLSILADHGDPTPGVVTGTVLNFQQSEWISVIRDQMDPEGLQIALRNTTIFEDRERDATLHDEFVRPGVRVTIWYKLVGERRPVAARVRVLAADAR
jgi:hypothetical protein